MPILLLVAIILAIGALIGLARWSGYVDEQFLRLATVVSIGGIVLYIVFHLLGMVGAIDGGPMLRWR